MGRSRNSLPCGKLFDNTVALRKLGPIIRIQHIREDKGSLPSETGGLLDFMIVDVSNILPRWTL